MGLQSRTVSPFQISPDTTEECLPFWPQQRVRWLQSEALGVLLPPPTQVAGPRTHRFLFPVNTVHSVSSSPLCKVALWVG